VTDWHDSGICVFTNVTVSDNHTDNVGGGIRIDDGSIELWNVAIADNSATGGASALALICCDNAILENVLVSGDCEVAMPTRRRNPAAAEARGGAARDAGLDLLTGWGVDGTGAEATPLARGGDAATVAAGVAAKPREPVRIPHRR
jgi:hypothetical protein